MLLHLAFVARSYVLERRFEREASFGPEDAAL
jgi:hypothetical protein